MKSLVLIGLSTLAIGCGGKGGTPASGGDNPCGTSSGSEGVNPCGIEAGGSAAEVGVDWTSWSSWTKVNEEAFVSTGHKKPWVNVYVPDEYADTYAALAGEMPQGFAVVKSVHGDDNGAPGEAKNLTVMAKMGGDYDPDNGNWNYGVLSADGSKAMQEGKLEMCINCHGSGTDYLFGVPK